MRTMQRTKNEKGKDGKASFTVTPFINIYWMLAVSVPNRRDSGWIQCNKKVGKRAKGDTNFLGHVRQTGIMSSDILTTKLLACSQLAEDLSQVEALGPSPSLRNEKPLQLLTCARERMVSFGAKLSECRLSYF